MIYQLSTEKIKRIHGKIRFWGRTKNEKKIKFFSLYRRKISYDNTHILHHYLASNSLKNSNMRKSDTF